MYHESGFLRHRVHIRYYLCWWLAVSAEKYIVDISCGKVSALFTSPCPVSLQLHELPTFLRTQESLVR